jgi:hypothetical protein
MPQQHPLSALIRPIGSRREVKENECRKVIAYDIRAQRAVDPHSFNLFGKYQYFCVDTSKAPSHKLNNILVEDVTSKCKAPISVEYVVDCDRDRAYQLVKACYGQGDPGKFVDSIILKSIKGLEGEHKEERKPLLDEREEWRDKLESRISADLSRMGLTVRMLDVKLVQRHSDEPIVGSWAIESSLLDLFDDEKATIKLNARIDVDPSRYHAFLLDERGPDGLKKDIGTWVQRFFDLKVGIAQFQPRHRGGVESGLRTELDGQLAERGWRLVNLEIDLTPPFELPVSQKVIQHPVQCSVKDRTSPVKVDHQLLVCLKDWKRWKKNCGEDPEPVLKAAIERATSRVLFNMSYLQLIKAFNLPQMPNGQSQEDNQAIRAIKDRISEVAENIGYEVEQLVSLPDAPVVILQRNGLDCRFDDELPLQDNRIKGKVNVRLFAQLPDLGEIEAYLRDDDLEKKISKDMRRQLERVLVRTTPHRFHTQFSATGNGTPSVVKELQTAIGQRLGKEYKLKNMEVSIGMGETELSKRFLSLARGMHEASVEIVVGRGELGEAATGDFGAEKMPFTVRYAVEGIDGTNPDSWFRFQVRDYNQQMPDEEIGAINKVLADELSRFLDQLPAAALRSTEFQKDDVQLRIKQLLAKKIVEDFGIVITISSLSRREAASDDFILDQGEILRETQLRQYRATGKERANQVESAKDSLEQLRKQRLDLVMKDPGDPRVGDLDEQIAKLEASVRIKDGHAASIAAPRKVPQVSQNEKVSISDHLDILSGKGADTSRIAGDEEREMLSDETKPAPTEKD